MDRKLRSQAAVALLRTRRPRLKRIETADDPTLRLCERTTRRSGFDRAVRVQGRAKSSSMPQMQPQRYPAAYDAIRRFATGLTLFPHLFFVLLPVRKTRAARAKERGNREKNQFHVKLNRQPRYSKSSRGTRRARRPSILWTNPTNQPVSFMNITPDGSRWRATSTVSYFSNVSLVNVRRYWKMLRYYTRVLARSDQLHFSFLIIFLN